MTPLEQEGFIAAFENIDDASFVPLTVVAAAIRTDDGRVWSLPKPARHHDVIRMIHESGCELQVGGERQGFLMSNGYFARRKPALAFARRANQILNGRIIGGVLTSEDLW